MKVLSNSSGKWRKKKPFLPFPSAQFHPLILVLSVTALFPLPFLSIQDLSAGDPALQLENILIFIPKKIRVEPIHETQRLTTLLEITTHSALPIIHFINHLS